MTDIVKQLRDEAGTGSGVIPLLAKAADEIERLGRELDEAKSRFSDSVSQETYENEFQRANENARKLIEMGRELAEAKAANGELLRRNIVLRDSMALDAETIAAKDRRIQELERERDEARAYAELLLQALRDTLECLDGCMVFITSREKINAQEGPGWIAGMTAKARAALAKNPNAGRSSVAEQPICNRKDEGSNPSPGTHSGDALTVAMQKAAKAEQAAFQSELKLIDMEAQKNGAYEERNKVVAALAWMAVWAGWKAGIAKTAIEGWSEDWHGCVYIDLPSGQVSWHYHDSHASLFEGLPPYRGSWDGHDTPEKYRRVGVVSEVLREGGPASPRTGRSPDFLAGMKAAAAVCRAQVEVWEVASTSEMRTERGQEVAAQARVGALNCVAAIEARAAEWAEHNGDGPACECPENVCESRCGTVCRAFGQYIPQESHNQY